MTFRRTAMTNLISQNIILNSEDANDIKISPNGDGSYEIRIGGLFINFRNYQDLKRFCLNIESEFEKFNARHIELYDCKTPESTISYVNSQFKKILDNWSGEK